MIELNQYRDLWLAEKLNEFIGFYNREFYCLDNFSSFGFDFEGRYYQTVEHAYQSLKFRGIAPEIEKQIIQCRSAHEAKKIAYENLHLQVEDWDTVKFPIMERLLRAKIAQNPYVLQKLLQTGDALICEDSPYDSYWGIGADRNGCNKLGKLWMKLREEFRREKRGIENGKNAKK